MVSQYIIQSHCDHIVFLFVRTVFRLFFCHPENKRQLAKWQKLIFHPISVLYETLCARKSACDITSNVITSTQLCNRYYLVISGNYLLMKWTFSHLAYEFVEGELLLIIRFDLNEFMLLPYNSKIFADYKTNPTIQQFSLENTQSTSSSTEYWIASYDYIWFDSTISRKSCIQRVLSMCQQHHLWWEWHEKNRNENA